MCIRDRGETVIRDAQELKVKESNRIAAMVAELTKAGVDVEETDDGMICLLYTSPATHSIFPLFRYSSA